MRRFSKTRMLLASALVLTLGIGVTIAAEPSANAQDTVTVSGFVDAGPFGQGGRTLSGVTVGERGNVTDSSGFFRFSNAIRGDNAVRFTDATGGDRPYFDGGYLVDLNFDFNSVIIQLPLIVQLEIDVQTPCEYNQAIVAGCDDIAEEYDVEIEGNLATPTNRLFGRWDITGTTSNGTVSLPTFETRETRISVVGQVSGRTGFGEWNADQSRIIIILDPVGPMCLGSTVTIDMTKGDSGVGTPGVDVVLGTSGDDVIKTFGGNDKICAGGGDDDVNAGSGDDEVSGGSGDDSLNGANGADLIRGWTGEDTIVGGFGDDTVYGGPDDDIIRGENGNDLLSGGTGDDFVAGNQGGDTLLGNSDDDVLVGGRGYDTMLGGAGNDLLNGQLGNDELSGGSGDDDLRGGAGSDEIRSGSGSDVISGGSGTNSCLDISTQDTATGCGANF